MEFVEDKSEQRITLPIKRKHLDKFILTTEMLAGLDLLIVPTISQMFTGEYKFLHEHLGLPPDTGEIWNRVGAVYWSLTALYSAFLREKFLGKIYC